MIEEKLLVWKWLGKKIPKKKPMFLYNKELVRFMAWNPHLDTVTHAEWAEIWERMDDPAKQIYMQFIRIELMKITCPSVVSWDFHATPPSIRWAALVKTIKGE